MNTLISYSNSISTVNELEIERIKNVFYGSHLTNPNLKAALETRVKMKRVV